MPLYNMTEIGQNSSSVIGFVSAINESLMQGMLGVMFIIAVTTILLFAFLTSTNNMKISMTAASFIAGALALLMKSLNLIPDLALFIILIGSALAIAFSFKT